MLTTVPVESLVQIADAIEFFWNKEGSIFVNDLNATFLHLDGNASVVFDVNARQFCLSDDCIDAWADVNGVVPDDSKLNVSDYNVNTLQGGNFGAVGGGYLFPGIVNIRFLTSLDANFADAQIFRDLNSYDKANLFDVNIASGIINIHLTPYSIDSDLNGNAFNFCDANEALTGSNDCVSLDNFFPPDVSIFLEVSDYNVSTLTGGLFGAGDFIFPSTLTINLDLNLFLGQANIKDLNATDANITDLIVTNDLNNFEGKISAVDVNVDTEVVNVLLEVDGNLQADSNAIGFFDSFTSSTRTISSDTYITIGGVLPTAAAGFTALCSGSVIGMGVSGTKGGTIGDTWDIETRVNGVSVLSLTFTQAGPDEDHIIQPRYLDTFSEGDIINHFANEISGTGSWTFIFANTRIQYDC